MEETLYTIDIHKKEDTFLGQIFSNEDGTKEFKNKRLEELLRDMSFDMQLAMDTFSERTAEFAENKGQSSFMKIE